MTFTLLSTASDFYWPVMAATGPGKAEYCMRHGYQLDLRKHVDYLFSGPWGEREQFMQDSLMRLPADGWLFFMGADAMITNMGVTLESIVKGREDQDFIIANDRFGINNDVFLLKAGEKSLAFLVRILSIRNRHQNDQAAMWEIINTWKEFNTMVIDQRIFNAYRYDEYGEPGREGSWAEGDFVLHLPGMTNERRLELIAETLPKVVR